MSTIPDVSRGIAALIVNQLIMIICRVTEMFNRESGGAFLVDYRLFFIDYWGTGGHWLFRLRRGAGSTKVLGTSVL